ncbi:hypothetical protein L1987_40846 [Smallanthus sonchifolius]|uniref:Uncharacterized protein n=1 Tax=Smallanthus sonchifolius TaxID=185202 RepID=A0ACB9GVU6_9ASTR|nr:hypothetical protein L1987_40846 [Smallanthus sonchifolius]
MINLRYLLPRTSTEGSVNAHGAAKIRDPGKIWNNSAFDDSEIKSPSWLTNKPVLVNLSSKENQSPIGLSKSCVLAHKSKSFKQHPIKTDEEIEIENQISRLFAKLESIRAKKISRNKIQRRGFSVGPTEIMSSATNSKSKQNRRKSCFLKLDDIEDERSRGKNPNLRQAVTTVGSKKVMRKDDLILESVRPKKLFGEPAKKSIKAGRVVPSRYNQATVNSSMKKRSFTEPKSRGGSGTVKKKWDVQKRLDLDDNVVMGEVLLPRIRVGRCVEEAGQAKRVVELVGKKSYFDEEAVCQKLSFDED